MNISDKSCIEVREKRITVIGAGLSGTSTAILASYLGAKVFISDSSSSFSVANTSSELVYQHHIAVESGIQTNKIYDADLWIISPGVPKNSDIIVKAKERNIPIVGEIEFASWFTKSPIVAVTGSNGKTTTSFIINEMLNSQDYCSVVAGNIGIPFSSEVLKEIINPNDKQIYVLECSSFQMEFIYHFKPKIAVFTNISEDHLDRHLTMSEYINMKLELVKNMNSEDYIIYNMDDKILVEAFGRKVQQKFPFSIKDQNCIFKVQDGLVNRTSGNINLNLNDLKIRGEHNLYNFLAASTCSHVMGISDDQIFNVIKNFNGLEHRLEHVAIFNGIEFINDSKATNIESVIVAIKAFDRPIVLLLGGYNKKSNFRLLLPHIKSNHVRAIISYGEAGGQINTALGDAVRLVREANLKSAVNKAQILAKPGELVLLSPGCASFDEFSNFEERGNFFKKTVYELSHK